MQIDNKALIRSQNKLKSISSYGRTKQNVSDKKFSFKNSINNQKENIRATRHKNTHCSPLIFTRIGTQESEEEIQEKPMLPMCKSSYSIYNPKKLNITDIEKSLLRQNHSEKLLKFKTLFHSKDEKNHFRHKYPKGTHSDKFATTDCSANLKTQESTNQQDAYITIDENPKISQTQIIRPDRKAMTQRNNFFPVRNRLVSDESGSFDHEKNAPLLKNSYDFAGNFGLVDNQKLKP